MSINDVQPKSDSQIKGVRIKYVNYAFIIILSFFIIVLFNVGRNIYTEYLAIKELAETYDRIQQDAEGVHNASDLLTTDAQLFVMRGETVYMDGYFKESNVDKHREAAIEDLKEMNMPDELIDLLEHSVEQSMELMQLEYQAMRYAAEAYHISVNDLPTEIKDTTLPAGAEKMSDEEKLKEAEKLVFGDEYYAYKGRIRDYQEQCLEYALNAVSEQKSAEHMEMRKLLFMLHLSLDFVGAICIGYFMMISRMVVNPLNRAVESIAQQNKIVPLKGTYEIKYMSYVYNEFHHDSAEIRKKLKREAERDILTGVLNRRGHQTVIDALSLEKYPIALLVVDIDNFKSVNDTYGHETGDVALCKLAHTLLETFRATDITSRVGGDEFVVIMGDVTEENIDIIEKKARMINEVLAVPGPEKCPVLTVSIGCAFSHNGYNDQIFDIADRKMYEIKRTGGKGIRF